MKSLEELRKIKEKAKKNLINREKNYDTRVEVAMSTCGITAGAREVITVILEELEKKEINNVHVSQTGCPGLCHYEPLITIIKPDNKKYVYGNIDVNMAIRIVDEHIAKDKPINEWLINLEK